MMLVYEAARQHADELLAEYWDLKLPVQLGVITQALGAEKLESSLGLISGMVVKEAQGKARIVLNSDEPPGRRRFTWAHELGHVVERAAIAKDDDYSFTDLRGGKYDLHEFYADEFAGALLMPESALTPLRESGKAEEALAREFDVTIAAVRKRLKRLESNPSVERTA